MPDTPPDRLSLDPRSPYYDEALLGRGVGIKFNGKEKTSVIEYSISEGWIRVVAGRCLGGIDRLRAALVAPFLICPAAERERGQCWRRTFRQGDRAGTDDSPFRAFIRSGDLRTQPRASELSEHRAYSS